MFKINWNKKAVKQLAKVDGQDRSRIATAVTALADLPNAQNVKGPDQSRIRLPPPGWQLPSPVRC